MVRLLNHAPTVIISRQDKIAGVNVIRKANVVLREKPVEQMGKREATLSLLIPQLTTHEAPVGTVASCVHTSSDTSLKFQVPEHSGVMN